jgi:hypothetical protein
MRAGWCLDATVLAALLALFLSLAPPASSAPYGYDEADYMYSVTLGAHASHCDSPSLPIADFLRMGLESGRAAARRTDLSQYIRSRNDVLFYRHWHGPLYYYPLMAAAALWHYDERAVRRLGMLYHLLAFALLYGGLRWLVPGEQGRVTALLAGCLYLFSPAAVRTAGAVMPHTLFVLLYLAAVLLLGKFRETGRLACWWGAVAVTGLALCTLEVGLVLVATLAACCWLERKGVFAGWAPRRWACFLAQSAGVLLGVVLLVWPAALWKLSLLKACLFMAYLSAKRESAWGEVGFFDSWRQRLLGAPVEWGLVALAVAIWVCVPRRRVRAALPALVFGGLMLASVLRVVSTYPRYTVTYLPALELFASLVLAAALMRLRPVPRYALLAAACLALLATSGSQLRRIQEPPREQAWALIDFVGAQGPENRRILVPQELVPVLHYYFPKTAISGYQGEGEAARLASTGQYDGVLSVEGTTPAYRAIADKTSP